jgi:multicomponent Na+:H+ antiporter subunit E
MRYIITFCILFLNWVIWSGKFDAFHLTLGGIACLIVTYTTHDLLFERKQFSFKDISEVIRLLLYIPWLIYQIVLANIHVASLVLNPRMPIDPKMIRFKSRLKKDISLVTFANSITLTPGTITADITDGEYYVHALNKKVADDLLSGEMENKVAHVFREN